MVYGVWELDLAERRIVVKTKILLALLRIISDHSKSKQQKITVVDIDVKIDIKQR